MFRDLARDENVTTGLLEEGLDLSALYTDNGIREDIFDRQAAMRSLEWVNFTDTDLQ